MGRDRTQRLARLLTLQQRLKALHEARQAMHLSQAAEASREAAELAREFDLEDSLFAVPAPEVEVVSTVGAGDTFCGYFASGLDLGLSIKDAVVRAVRAASKSCLLMDAQPSIPWARDL